MVGREDVVKGVDAFAERGLAGEARRFHQRGEGRSADLASPPVLLVCHFAYSLPTAKVDIDIDTICSQHAPSSVKPD
jgi:hypothetical protein